MEEKGYNLKVNLIELDIINQSIEKLQIFGRDAIVVGDLLRKVKIALDKARQEV